MKIILYLLLLIVCFAILFCLNQEIQKQEIKKKDKIKDLVAGNNEVSVDEFNQIRESYKGHLKDFDYVGCYVLHNCSKDMYYVGQSMHVPQRVNNHFSGKGNGDVYADFRNGDQFTIRTVSLTDSGYQRLDTLEKDLIYAYDANTKGYNKTSGNS